MKKSTVLLGTLACVATLAIPALTHANTYEYVNTLGNLETVTADTAAQALTIPIDIGAHSGVLLLPTVTLQNTYPVTTTTVTPAVTYTPTTMTNTSLPYNIVGTYTSTSTTGTYTMNNATPVSTLMLNQDGTASLMTTYTNGQSSSIQRGTWTVNTVGGGNQIQLMLNGSSMTGGVNSANTIVFTQNGTTLTASSYPSATYPQGLVFTMQSGTTATTSNI